MLSWAGRSGVFVRGMRVGLMGAGVMRRFLGRICRGEDEKRMEWVVWGGRASKWRGRFEVKCVLCEVG